MSYMGFTFLQHWQIMGEAWSTGSYGTYLGAGSGTMPSKPWDKQELLCADIAQLELGWRSKARRRFSVTTAWLIFFPPVTNKNFFLMSHFKTVPVQEKKQNSKIFLRNSLLVRQNKPLYTVRDRSVHTLELIVSAGFKAMGILLSFMEASSSLQHFSLKHIIKISKCYSSTFWICIWSSRKKGLLQKIASLSVAHPSIGLAYAVRKVPFLFSLFSEVT